MSIMPPTRREIDFSWMFNPPVEEMNAGWWEQCTCDCHYTNAVHCMPCCQGGWKLTFTGIIERQKKREREQEVRARKEQRAALYKPTHGGYPNV
jgi:hypothetical protein